MQHFTSSLPQHLCKKDNHRSFPLSCMGQFFFWYISQPSRQKFHLATPLLDFSVSQEKLGDTAAFLHRDSIWPLWIGVLTDLCLRSCFVFRVLSLSSAPLWQHFQQCQAGSSLRLEKLYLNLKDLTSANHQYC